MSELVHHLALALGVLALADTSLRVAALTRATGLERALAALVIAVSIAVIEALALGLVALGASPVALLAVTAALWLASRALLPDPEPPPGAELLDWLGGLDRWGKAVGAALVGAGLAWVAWQLRYPSIGFDSAVYHYPDIAGWIANGRPGSQLHLSYDIPYGNYPLTDEVAQTWGAAIARSYIPIALWNPLALAALVAATWRTLRNLEVPQPAAALGTAVMVATPLVIRQLNEPQNDLPALAWLACTAALATGAGRRPALLVPALAAAGLGIGTKATVAPEAIVALAYGLWIARDRLRPLAGWLALGLGAAVAVGGVWYLRNIVQHGSPLWPFVDVSWGDPSPRFLGQVDQTFLARPIETLDGRLGTYSARLGGGWILLAASLLTLIAAVAVVARRDRRLGRRLAVVSGLTVIGFLIWAGSWGTGLQTSPELPTPAGWPISALRYLAPVIGLATITVTLATTVRGVIGRLGFLVLAVSLVWSVVADAELGAPYAPRAVTLISGALIGLAVLALVELTRRRLPAARAAVASPGGRTALIVASALVVAALLAPVSNGYVERSTKVPRSSAPAAELVRWFLDRPGFDDGDDEIAISSRAVLVQLAGDHFTHELDLIPGDLSCREVDEVMRRHTLVVTRELWFRGLIGLNGYSGPRCVAHRRPVFRSGLDHAVYLPQSSM